MTVEIARVWSEEPFVFDVAFVTYQDSPDIASDDRLVADVLRNRGVGVVAAAWDDPAVDWSRFSRVVIRSPWNYHFHADRYSAWLRHCDETGVPLWNPPRVVLSNINKTYLLDLAQQGVEIAPLELVPAGSRKRLSSILEERGWDEVVVKPVVSAGAHQTWRTSSAKAKRDELRFQDQCRQEATLVQPFLDEILSQGEWSFLFFGGEFSHAVIKRPAAGDFRVQHQHGGEYELMTPSADLIQQAKAIVSKVDGALLYARVDGVVRDGRFLLIELEINEPFLFLGASKDAPEKFADAIMQSV
ncbi:ATP-grasp domain-containing protein [Planctomicrobium sp. SH661]|uniref:ATP-grasp domain-containing protein n=1 Tax=Planctomicrobium sp. SH661 TaxID=3448124 RepID=UPI003F5C6FE1